MKEGVAWTTDRKIIYEYANLKIKACPRKKPHSKVWEEENRRRHTSTWCGPGQFKEQELRKQTLESIIPRKLCSVDSILFSNQVTPRSPFLWSLRAAVSSHFNHMKHSDLRKSVIALERGLFLFHKDLNA